jgi:hypothetical protein
MHDMKTLIAAVLFLFALASFGQPVISTITPAAGPTSGGDYVRIHGAGFSLLTSPFLAPLSIQVSFGGVAAPIVGISDGSIVVIAPPHAAGLADVQIAQDAKAAVTIANGYRYVDPIPSDAIRFLAPIVVNAPGSFGSNWVSELRIANGSIETLNVSGKAIAPRTSTLVPLPAMPFSAGAFFAIPTHIAGNVTATLRVHDTSRDADGFGTEIPVVPETQFRPSVVLTAVPTDQRFRTTLRIYDDTNVFLTATVVIRDDASGDVLTSMQVPLSPYAQLTLDSTLAPLASAVPRVRLEITSQAVGVSSSQPIPIWAFVSVTNNITQEVTTITPSPIPSIAPVSALAQGHWAGGGNCVDVTATNVNLRFGCAVGGFNRPLAIQNGHFEADGVYQITPGAPPPEPIPSQSAHYSGTLSGNDLLLVVTLGTTPAFAIHVTFGSTEACFPPCP